MRRTRAGMTLMELVIGLVITGMMAIAGTAAFTSIIDHRRVITEATVETERAAALREMLRTWIGSGSLLATTRTLQTEASLRRLQTTLDRMNSMPGVSSEMSTVTAAVSTGDELLFTTNALTPTMTPNARVRLYVDGDPNTPEIGLSIEYQISTTSPLQRMQLDSTITMMTVEYLDRRTQRWYPFSEGASIRPIAARLSFPPVDGVYVPRLLQQPMLFVISEETDQAEAAAGGGGGGGGGGAGGGGDDRGGARGGGGRGGDGGGDVRGGRGGAGGGRGGGAGGGGAGGGGGGRGGRGGAR